MVSTPSILMTPNWKKAFGNAKTSETTETDENSKNSKNGDKDWETNLIQVPSIYYFITF